MKTYHIWNGGDRSLCGMPVMDADPELHHFEEDEGCADCEECLSIHSRVESEKK